MKKTFWVPKIEFKHFGRGIFQFKNRKPIKLLKGGHGQSNINYLIKNKLSFFIKNKLPNGVRVGSISCHKRKSERAGGHLWFPAKWSDETIKNAGLHVANLKRNKEVANHKHMKGRFRGVDVIATKRGRKITGIFPNKDMLNKE